MNSWIRIKADGALHEATENQLGQVAAHFSDRERSYIKECVEEVQCHPFAGRTSGWGGYYDAGGKCVAINSERPEPAMPIMELQDAKFTLAHELSHPLYKLAARQGIGGYLIINPELRKEAKGKAEALFPDAIRALDKALDGRETRKSLTPKDFSPEERVAVLTYMMLDDRYYDLFGSTNFARAIGVGYTAPNRNHEIACNLRALQACEADIVGRSDTHIVEQIAGDVLESLQKKLSKALQNPGSGGPKPQAQIAVRNGAG